MDNAPRLQLARDYTAPDQNRRQLSRAATSGNYTRLRRGAYYPSDIWANLTPVEKHRVRMAAVAATRGAKPVFSHESAAAFWGLPSTRPCPTSVHVTVEPSLGTRSRGDVVRHSGDLCDEDVIEFDDYLVTSIARTVLDLATTSPFIDAVVVADRALLVDRFARRPPPTTRQELEAAMERAKPLRAHARASAVLAFAVSEAESPLESISRVNLRAAGFPRPTLQLPHYDGAGYIGSPDFTWPEFAFVGEADGDIKYLDESIRGSRTADRVVLDEKIREDRLRALPRTVARWRWKTAMSPALLRRQLSAAGLPLAS